MSCVAAPASKASANPRSVASPASPMRWPCPPSNFEPCRSLRSGVQDNLPTEHPTWSFSCLDSLSFY
eukprot:3345454-Alexandrium_andersonii.AAC.1